MAILVLFLAACKEENPVKQTIDRVVDAAEDRDVEGVMKHLSTDFPGRSGVESTLRQYFFGYRTIDITVTNLEIDHSGSSGAATFRVNFIGVPKQIGGLDQMLPRTAVYRFDTQLAQRDGQWKILSAEWHEERR